MMMYFVTIVAVLHNSTKTVHQRLSVKSLFCWFENQAWGSR